MRLSQGGVKVPTGGNMLCMKPASALLVMSKGQQIQCDSGADGYSPDGRELTVSAFCAL